MQRIRYITKSAILQLRFNDIIFDAILCGVIESFRTWSMVRSSKREGRVR